MELLPLNSLLRVQESMKEKGKPISFLTKGAINSSHSLLSYLINSLIHELLDVLGHFCYVIDAGQATSLKLTHSLGFGYTKENRYQG